ncbi:uncharacterized protein EV154DRAFT_519275 [Mucor mucedo]|uniref:uncharacterized protein n=1 Tax=Mucor mucedo TaxID=29922 RepID=UPI0022202FF9|nr:uncharacterized protein EV154DRAFT_519275 [Mucor mucedo]KAI7887992.1 hypothetical protein EV154DRAFT_519275 [Mucor mucedo]
MVLLRLGHLPWHFLWLFFFCLGHLKTIGTDSSLVTLPHFVMWLVNCALCLQNKHVPNGATRAFLLFHPFQHDISIECCYYSIHFLGVFVNKIRKSFLISVSWVF